jgi:hypothetical protein
MSRHSTGTMQDGPSYRADATWWLPIPLRRTLLLTPPFALAVLEVFHPQPDFHVQALLDASTWFAVFHVIQLMLTGLVAMSVLLLASDFGRASAWVTRLGIGVFLVFFSAYDTLAGIGTGLAMRSARDLSAEQQVGVFTVVKDWPGLGPPFRTEHRRDARLGHRRRHSRAGHSTPRSIATRVDHDCVGRCVPAGWAPVPARDARLRQPLRRCAPSRMAIRSIQCTAWQEIIRTRRSTAMKRRLR